MNKYETYKPSYVVWIGDVPNHWRIQRLKDLVLQKITDGPHETPELVDDEDSIPFISAEAITENGINYEARGGNISAEQDRIYSLKCKPKKHDIFIVKSGSTTGRIGYVEIDFNFNIWSPLALVRSNKQTSSRFLFHYLSSDCIQRQIQNTWSFGTQPNIGMGVIERLRLSMPPSDEQLTIANYLDHQTQKIDRLIANKKAQAEKLKELRQIEINNAVTKGLNPNVDMKDSGIEWLGKIPKYWEVKRMKDLGELVMGKMLQNEDTGLDKLKPYLRSFNVQWDKVDASDVKEMWFSEAEMLQYRLKKFDIVVSEGGEVGRATIWLDEIDECYIQNSVYKITTNKRIIPYFLLYQFILQGKAGLFEMIVNKVSIGHLTKEKLVTVKFFVPPIEEQIQIANYLQERTTSIDKLIKNIDAQIEKLQELRKIKIYEAVTGKIKVNDYGQATA